MSAKADTPNYKKTLNLPRTPFAMKANLVQREPQFQKGWAKRDVYHALRERPHPKGVYTFHDGPPYANGDIHLGHLINKVLKDLVVRSHSLEGYDVPYVPGWDCHGLPIEHRVMQELGDEARGLSAIEIRRKCRKYAERFVKTQSRQMQRLGTLGDYEDPYLTMAPQYEADVLHVLADLVEAGLVFRALKPVHWSIDNATALADAELEYHDRQDTSIYVRFELLDPAALPDALHVPAGERVDVMIWTTTPWTLPANRGVAVAPAAEYGLYRYERDGSRHHALLACSLGQAVLEAGGADAIEELGRCRGDALAADRPLYRHPFLDDGVERPVVCADYVTLEDGTGLVHTAPGHGADDHQTGLREGLEVYCPVGPDGRFDATAPDWLRGERVWDANALVVERLRASGDLFRDYVFTHSYPHDWRSKTPTIFRATEQWFVGVDRPVRGGASLRERALEATANDVSFVPDWGRNRLRGMLESRPDWCLSRQRAWGLPIPAFYGPENGQVLLTAASVRAVAELVREKGSDVWFLAEPEVLLQHYDVSADPEAPDWFDGSAGALASLRRCDDILDVWFESGSSWNAVLRARGLGYPADLYLEGSDQHRGWFQLSLLPALGVTQQAPFREVVTHGFMLDSKGMKMSKSGDNAIVVDDLLQDLGADVCRWWVGSLNYSADFKVDLEFLRLAGEEYRKVRNTLRFLLGNLGDFDPATDRRELGPADAQSLDAWALARLDELIGEVRRAYLGHQFRSASRALFGFCNDTLSAVYLAAVKDRLYCDPVDAERRRRCQTVLWDMASALIRLAAPILVHTAEEAWQALGGESNSDASVHEQVFPEPVGAPLSEHWDEAMALRGRALKALEAARETRGIDNWLDAGVSVTLPADACERLEPFADDLADLCGTSRFEIAPGSDASIEIADLSDEPRCDRSWKRDSTVRERSDGGMLSDRDAAAVGV